MSEPFAARRYAGQPILAFSRLPVCILKPGAKMETELLSVPQRIHQKQECRMSRKVADGMWEMLADAGVKRCYGIVGDALNPVIDALRRNGKIEFIHVRHEEYGVFAAVAEACLAGNPVAVCGTAGPGVVHLFNGLMDARKEGAPIIAIAGDVETSLIDTSALEELNPYQFFEAASLYTGRIVNPAQARAIINTAI